MISEKRTIDPHVTTMFCYNAIGEKMKPFIILPHMPFLPFVLLLLYFVSVLNKVIITVSINSAKSQFWCIVEVE